ncbi:MAG: bifunctional folylpolyglutamate synthase/dihydrofolate synthase [Nitrospira sp.]|nr:bifunctional folylpolyglutamate synthase/dihydrofolate synthase [Nitrospira sp.]
MFATAFPDDHFRILVSFDVNMQCESPVAPMTYPATVQFLYGLQLHGIKLGLETIRTLLARVGDPHRRYPVLHIGGTNGKGSTAAMTASILQASGHRVGLYTSPHLIDFRERIRVNGEMIPESRVIHGVELLRAASAPDLAPTFFEFTTALAFHHFAECQVDVVVLEVGLGGRFDATNVVEPLAAAITTIGLDHEAYLGSTTEAIAMEKAGIIKPGVPVVLGRIGEPASRVIEERASTVGAPVLRLDRDFRCEGSSPTDCGYTGFGLRLDHLSCPLQGRFQLDNLACSLALIELAHERGVTVTETSVRAGLQQVAWEGRLEIVGQEPTVMVDGAHNPAAATVLAEYLSEWKRVRPAARLCLIVGMMRDKHPREFLAPLLPLIDTLILTQADLPRAALGSELRLLLEHDAPFAQVAPTPSDALAMAKHSAAASDVVCVTGSLMLVGEIKALLRGDSLSPVRG